MTFARHSRDGFTLIEILIAIALVVIMGAIAIPGFLSYLERGRKKATVATLKSVKTNIDVFYSDVGQYPETLKDLIKKPQSEELAAHWDGPYLSGKNEPVDGWNIRLHYQVVGEGEHPYELYSYGSNKGKATPKEKWINVWDL